MKRFVLVAFMLFLGLTLSFAKETDSKVILFVSEQNIEGPQKAWWASEIDLSVTEATIAKKFIEQDYQVLEPSVINKIIRQRPAFRRIGLSERESIKLGKLSKADYVVLGKAIASSGGNVPQSNMRSCFANVTVKLIRIRDGKVVAYLDASGNSAHMDVITGGKEALVNAGEDLAIKLIDVLNKSR